VTARASDSAYCHTFCVRYEFCMYVCTMYVEADVVSPKRGKMQRKLLFTAYEVIGLYEVPIVVNV